MQRPWIAALFAGSFMLFGCPSQESLCRSGVDQVCERVFECQSDEVKQSDQFKAAFGTSEDNCKELLYANPLRPQGAQGVACSEVDTNEKLCGNLGQPTASDFDLSKADDCRDARDKLSCEAYLNQLLVDPGAAPAACAERCSE